MMIRRLFNDRVRYCAASAAPQAVQFGIIAQHTGLMMWAFVFVFLYYFIVSGKTATEV